MVRECLAGTWFVVAGSGCSLVLSFSDDKIPKDAQIDGPSSQDECDYKEPNDTAATAAPITPADVGPAGICGDGFDDHDFYKFTVPVATASVTVKISFHSSPTGDLDLRLYDKTGATELARSTGIGDDETIICPAASPLCAMLAPDDYVFEVFPANAGSVNRYDIALTLTPM